MVAAVNLLAIYLELKYEISNRVTCVVLQNNFSKLITTLEKYDNKWRRLSEDKKLRLERMKIRKDAFLDRIPEDEDVAFNVNIFHNSTVEQVLKENSRYGIHNAYRA